MLLSKAKNSKMEEVRQYIPVSISSDFDSLAPHIANAERDYLIPVISQEIYDELQGFYDGYTSQSQSGSSSGSTDAPDLKLELLGMVQSCVTHIAFWIGYHLLNSSISDDGFRRIESEKIKGLYKYQEDSLKNYFRTNGFNRLDTVLQFLEYHAPNFPLFALSAQYTVLKMAFIPNTAAFNRIVFIGNSRLTFLRMVPHIQLIEEIEILPIMGQIALAELKDEMLKTTPNPRMIAIIPLIQKAVAFLSSAYLMEESGADLTDNGLYFSSVTAINISGAQNKPSDPTRINTLVKRNRNIGTSFLDQIRSYLVSHASDWTDVAPSTGRALRRDNLDKKTFWT